MRLDTPAATLAYLADRRRKLLAAFTVLLLVYVALTTTSATMQIPEDAHEISVDASEKGPRFDGVGAISANGSSRLLYDYPEPQRSQILDYLFTPGYGASLDMLKVEIGAETNSTAGAEPTHQRTRGEVDCNRGYQWWLMREAVKRNPDIVFAGLAWGAPGWFDGGFWSQDNIDYHLNWLRCAQSHGLTVDYMGGWNEHGYDPGWFAKFDRALQRSFPNVRLIAGDDCCRDDLWRVADTVAKNQRFREVVDVLGVHFVCGHRTEYRTCSSPTKARKLNKPLWMSENSTMVHDHGGPLQARALNRSYLDAEVTGNMVWTAVSSWYANLPVADTGLILAEWPWSGHYRVGKTAWALAHTTQFSDPGWHHIDSASGALDTGATYVTRASGEGDFSTVIETVDADRPSTVSLKAIGGSAQDPLQVWSTDMRSDNPADHFVYRGELQELGDRSPLHLEPGHVYTVTTVSDDRAAQSEQTAQAPGTPREELPIPFTENFEGDPHGQQAPLFADLNGAFEVQPCAPPRRGNCYRQQTPRRPIPWSQAGTMPPTTIFGDPRWWGDYELSSRIRLENRGSAELAGRISNHGTASKTINGYFLRVTSGDGWQLYAEDQFAGRRVLTSGTETIKPNQWHEVALRMTGDHFQVVINGEIVGSARDARGFTGNAALRVGEFDHAQFDDVAVTPTAARPNFVPQQEITATASSESPMSGGYVYPPLHVLDHRPATTWRADPELDLPATLTLDLGFRRRVDALTVQPSHDIFANANITEYRVLVSEDGKHFTPVMRGSWENSLGTKLVELPAGTTARFIQVEALDTADERAGIGEVNVIRAPR